MVDNAGHEGAGARHLLGRLRRPAGAVAGRHAAGVDVEPRGGGGAGQIFLAQWNHQKALDGASRQRPLAGDRIEDAMTTPCSSVREPWLRCLSLRWRRERRRPSRTAHRRRQDHAPHVETLASERFEGRLAGSEGERLAADYLVARAEAHRRAAAAGPEATIRLPFSSPPAAKDGGSTLHVAAPPTAMPAASRIRRDRPGAGAVVFGQRRGDGRGGLRRLRPRRARIAELRLRQLRRRSTSRTRSSSCCATSPRTPTRRRGRSWRATPTCATRRWRRGSAAPRRCSSSPARARPTPARRCR